MTRGAVSAATGCVVDRVPEVTDVGRSPAAQPRTSMIGHSVSSRVPSRGAMRSRQLIRDAGAQGAVSGCPPSRGGGRNLNTAPRPPRTARGRKPRHSELRTRRSRSEHVRWETSPTCNAARNHLWPDYGDRVAAVSGGFVNTSSLPRTLSRSLPACSARLHSISARGQFTTAAPPRRCSPSG